MKITKLAAITAALAATLSINAPFAIAEDPSPSPTASPTATPAASPPANNPDQGGRNRPSPEEFRQRMNDRLKTALKATDDEWTVIQPLLEKVQDKQREAGAGRGFGGWGGGAFGGRRGGGPQTSGSGGQTAADQGNANRPDRVVPPEVQALRTALDSDSTTPAVIKADLQALRDARKKAAGELDQARQDLVKVLSQRQEATLVLMGILE